MRCPGHIAQFSSFIRITSSISGRRKYNGEFLKRFMTPENRTLFVQNFWTGNGSPRNHAWTCFPVRLRKNILRGQWTLSWCLTTARLNLPSLTVPHSSPDCRSSTAAYFRNRPNELSTENETSPEYMKTSRCSRPLKQHCLYNRIREPHIS